MKVFVLPNENYNASYFKLLGQSISTVRFCHSKVSDSLGSVTGGSTPCRVHLVKKTASGTRAVAFLTWSKSGHAVFFSMPHSATAPELPGHTDRKPLAFFLFSPCFLKQLERTRMGLLPLCGRYSKLGKTTNTSYASASEV